jgi:hypothetical protein
MVRTSSGATFNKNKALFLHEKASVTMTVYVPDIVGFDAFITGD